MRIVDPTGRPTPAFLQMLSKLNTSANDSMPAPSPLNIQADYTGAFLAGELPATVQLQRLSNGADVSGLSTWSMAVVSGTITATISAGVITVTALGSLSAMLQVRSMRNGVALYDMVSVNKVIGATPLTGSGGSASSSATTFSSISSTTPVAITSQLSVTVGSSGIVALSAPLSVSTSRSAPDGDYPVFGRWWNVGSSSWVDVAVQSNPDCVVSATTEDTVPPTTFYAVNKGTLTVNQQQSGLTAGSTAKFELFAWNGSGTRTMTFSGTASAVPQ
jgi:hypothetical protein